MERTRRSIIQTVHKILRGQPQKENTRSLTSTPSMWHLFPFPMLPVEQAILALGTSLYDTQRQLGCKKVV